MRDWRCIEDRHGWNIINFKNPRHTFVSQHLGNVQATFHKNLPYFLYLINSSVCQNDAWSFSRSFAIFCCGIKKKGNSHFSEIYIFLSFPTIHTGCPKSSFLYFIGLYFSTIRLDEQIFQTKVVYFNLVKCYKFICCAFFWLEYLICAFSLQRCASACIFPAKYFFVFCSWNC